MRKKRKIRLWNPQDLMINQYLRRSEKNFLTSDNALVVARSGVNIIIEVTCSEEDVSSVGEEALPLVPPFRSALPLCWLLATLMVPVRSCVRRRSLRSCWHEWHQSIQNQIKTTEKA